MDNIFYLSIFIISFIFISISVFYFYELKAGTLSRSSDELNLPASTSSEGSLVEGISEGDNRELDTDFQEDNVLLSHNPPDCNQSSCMGFTSTFDVYPTATISSAGSGDWETASTWSGGVPQAGDVVLIQAGHTVIFNSVNTPNIKAVNIDGKLSFSRAQNTKLNVGYIYVREDGTLDLGTVTSPINDPFTAEIHFYDGYVPMGDIDPGISSFGNVTMHGQARQDNFVRTTIAPMTGAST